MSLRAGDWVEIRSEAEILATLDDQGQLERLPFMPEMLQYCGKRFQVWTRAHKTCDTVNRTGGRRMEATVHLKELRCDGRAHGGCEAACLLFWKEAWLKPVSGPCPADRSPAQSLPDSPTSIEDCDPRLRAGAMGNALQDSVEPVYRCQATELPAATTPLKWWDLRQYAEDFTSGNVPIRRLAAGGIYVIVYALVALSEKCSWRAARLLMGLYDRVQRLLGGPPYPRRRGTIPRGRPTPATELDLKPGEVVRVRPYEEILATLDGRNRNRGMLFDAEEVPYCGKPLRVRSCVRRIVDERTGRMITLKGRNVLLEGAWCQARYSDRRMFCPRAIFPIWREAWLERVGQNTASSDRLGRMDGAP